MMNLVRKRLLLGVGTAALAVWAAGAQATAVGEKCLGVADCLVFDTELVSLELTGGPYLMPLAADPGFLLPGTIEGYGMVESTVSISLSSQRSVSPGPNSFGETIAFARNLAMPSPPPPPGELPVIDPDKLHGETFIVDSFFDVFFDIIVTDVDSRLGHNFAGQADGASIVLPDNGPAHMSTQYERVFDKDAPNFGMIPPPEVSPYIGHFNIVIPLGGDINGNGVDDIIKFQLAAHSAADGTAVFTILPDGTVIDEFDSAAFLEGAVLDETTDPPFELGENVGDSENPIPGFDGASAMTGPTVATSRLVNNVVPEPGSLALLAAGVAGLGFAGWRRRRA